MQSCIIRRPILYTIFGISLLSQLIACTPAETRPANLTLRIGMPVAEVIDAYGSPVSIDENNELNRYTWNLSEARLASNRDPSRPSVSSSGVVSYSNASLPKVVTIRCTLVASVTPDRKVYDWQASGDGCRQILFQQI